jgi:uroporphyrin-III C-methyltransferase/precorrin-2 dehydrogenase/sirohydrochlorin ferrochelatase
MSSPSYALTLDLTGRRVLVVGGGPVATRRVRGLLEAGAAVEVVAPWVTEELAGRVATGGVVWHQRDYAAGDLSAPTRAWLVHSATGDPVTDTMVAAEAESIGVWCVRAGDAAASPAWTPAVAHGASASPAEGLSVAVTAGGDPRRAQAVRDAVAAALDSGTLPVRRFRRAGLEPEIGRVALVGGGPGADDLITVRGRALLAAADVVVTDRLGPTGLLAGLAEDVEVVQVGKMPGHHPVPQDGINELLVHHARQGRQVVRLKGGDPFVLGRGGEEALFCAEHGVPVEVVPGVTSAVSVPAAAGIPVTHRGITASFVVASAHDGSASAEQALRDAPADATLVLLMGVTGLAGTAKGLIAAGRSPSTPVALVESGWTEGQRTTTTTLEHAAADAEAAGVRAPAVIVVGDVVRVREQLGDLAGALPSRA